MSRAAIVCEDECSEQKKYKQNQQKLYKYKRI